MPYLFSYATMFHIALLTTFIAANSKNFIAAYSWQTTVLDQSEVSPPPSALSPPLSAPPIPLTIVNPAEEAIAGPAPDPITPAEEEDDDVFENEPTTPAEVEADTNKRRSQSLSALHTKEPQSPSKVRPAYTHTSPPSLPLSFSVFFFIFTRKFNLKSKLNLIAV